MHPCEKEHAAGCGVCFLQNSEEVEDVQICNQRHILSGWKHVPDHIWSVPIFLTIAAVLVGQRLS